MSGGRLNFIWVATGVKSVLRLRLSPARKPREERGECVFRVSFYSEAFLISSSRPSAASATWRLVSCKLLHGWRRGGPQQLLVPARLKEIYILKKKETSEQPGLSPKDASTCRQEEVELTLPHKPWHWIMFPRSSRSFSSDFKLLYGVISVFYVQSQVLRPPFFTTSYRITRRLEPGVTWYLFSCLRVQTEKKKGISLNCKFRIVPSVSRIETAISRSHPQPSRGRVFFFFLLMRSTHAHADTHTPLRGFP